MATRRLQAGDVVRVELAGGGGYGPPEARDPASVALDVQEQVVSLEEARATYNVALDPVTLEVDRDATARLRGY
jgi:N-methylhydantoinase B